MNVVKSIVVNLPPFVLPIGVFVNAKPENVRKTMDECGLALAQIHGDESAEYCESLGRPVIRGIRLRDRHTLFAMAEYKGRSRVRGFHPGCLFNDSLWRNRQNCGLGPCRGSRSIFFLFACRGAHFG